VFVSLCASCRITTHGDAGLCPHHHGGHGGHDWAVANRIMCDFFHRQRVPRRLPEAEREDDFTTVTRSHDAEGYIVVQINGSHGVIGPPGDAGGGAHPE
jgi:hypothetical protein